MKIPDSDFPRYYVLFPNMHDFKNLADIFTFQTLKHLPNLNW